MKEDEVDVVCAQLIALRDCLETMEERGLTPDVLTQVTAVVVEVLKDYEERYGRGDGGVVVVQVEQVTPLCVGRRRRLRRSNRMKM